MTAPWPVPRPSERALCLYVGKVDAGKAGAEKVGAEKVGAEKVGAEKESAEDDPADAMENISDREGSALVPKSPAKTEAVELSKVLQELKLERYQRACDRCGYDDWQEIVEMDGGALDTMVARLKLAPNHADRLLQHVRACRLKQQPHARVGRQPSNKDDDCVLL